MRVHIKEKKAFFPCLHRCFVPENIQIKIMFDNYVNGVSMFTFA